MAGILLEGFDHLQNGSLPLKGWSASPTSIVADRIRGSAARITLSLSSNASLPSKTLPSSYSNLIVGFAHRFSLAQASTLDIFQIRSVATATARVGLDANHHLIIRNSAGTTIATGTTVLTVNTWYYIEVQIFINGASGTCEVHLNGATEIASTVGNFGSVNLDNIAYEAQEVSGGNNTINFDFDDIYVADTTGAAPRNTFWGDISVETLYPSADGAHSQWTPDTGVMNFSRVNEKAGTFPDGDTSFVSDATPGDRDTYVVDDLVPLAGTIFSLQTNLYARKDDAALRQIADVIRQGGSDFDGATATLSTSYLYYSQIHNQDPSGADWTVATVNADEFGIKEVA